MRKEGRGGNSFLLLILLLELCAILEFVSEILINLQLINPWIDKDLMKDGKIIEGGERKGGLEREDSINWLCHLWTFAI